MYTIFIVVTKKNEKEKKQHLDNVHNIHCCNPRKKKSNIGQCTIRYKGGQGGDWACQWVTCMLGWEGKELEMKEGGD